MNSGVRELVSRALVAYGALPYHPGKWRVVDSVCGWAGLNENPPRPSEITRQGFRFAADPKNYIDRTLYYLRVWEGHTTAFVESCLQPGMVVIDAGANIGWYTLTMARAVGPSGLVYAFEPAAEELSRLRSNVRLNGFDHVRIKPFALAETVGWATLSDTLDAGTTYVGGGKHQIQTTSLDTLMSDEKLHRVDFIKMDVEGSELRVLHGARELLRRFRPMLMVELEPVPLSRMGTNPQAVMAFLRSEGYELRELVRGHLAPLREETLPRNAFAVPTR